MKTKVFEILIVIVGVLVMAFVVGFIGDYLLGAVESAIYYGDCLEHGAYDAAYCPKCDSLPESNAIYFDAEAEGSDFVIVEVNEPNVWTWEGDPNAVITYDPINITIAEVNETEPSWRCDDCGEGFPELLSMECLCGKKYNTLKLVMKNIPTWPDYIELEKDLVFDISNRVRNPADETFTFVKGTRIYFRDD